MNGSHANHHEELLRSLVLRDRVESADERELAACAECAPRIAELRAADEALRSAGAVERDAILQTAADRAGPPGQRRALTALEHAMDRESSGGTPNAFLRLRIGVAAAVVLVAAVLTFRASSSDPVRDHLFVGANDVELLEPVGEVPGFDRFAWQANVPRGGTYEVRIWDAGAADDSAPLLTSETLSESRWIPARSSKVR